MRRLVVIFCFLFLFQMPSFGQFENTSAWIDFTKTYFRLAVAEDGIYRVSKADLKAKGLPVETISNDNYQIFENGKEIAINVTAEYIEFYGQKPKGDLDYGLYEDIQDQTAKNFSQYLDSAYYYLTIGTAKGLRYTPVTSTDFSGLTIVNTHNKKHYLNYKNGYNYGARNSGSLLHPNMGAGEGRSSIGLAFFNSLTDKIDISDIVSGETAKFSTTIIGQNNRTDFIIDGYNQHALVQYNLNGWKNLGEKLFTGYTRQDLSFDITKDMYSSTFEFKIFTDANYLGEKNKFRGLFTLNEVLIEYLASTKLINEKGNVFNIIANSNDLQMQITNFAGNSPIIFDITNNNYYNFIQTGSTISIRLKSSPIDRQIAVYDASKIDLLIPRKLIFKKINYSPETNYLIISNKRLKSSVSEYANFRSSLEGGSYNVSVVYVDEIFNQYYFGYHHPLAIKTFLKDLLKNNLNPKNVFFIGKALNLTYLGDDNSRISNDDDLVPSIGSPCADWYYGRYLTPEMLLPPFTIGRFSARTNKEVSDYLKKVKAYEQLDINKWRKDVIHVSGGKSGSELIRFQNYMRDLGAIIEGPKPGANISYFGKENGLEIDAELKDKIILKANEGAGFFSYFGHAGANTTEVDLGEPLDYNNANNPLIMYFGGCVLGGCYEEAYSMGEDFLKSSTGAVVWIASSTFSFESTVYDYTTLLYKEIAQDSYGKELGQIVNSTMNKFMVEGDIFKESQCWQTVFQGDPAVKMYGPNLPDYEITSSDVFISPDKVTAQSDSFYINFIIKNNGLAIESTLPVYYKITSPNGSVFSDTVKITSVYNTDTFSFIYYNKSKTFGEHSIDIYLDPNNIFSELRENNNSTTFKFNLVSNGSVGLFPTNFGIVNDKEIELIAQSLSTISSRNIFQFEIDTTPNFKSNWRKRSGEIKGDLIGNFKLSILDKDSQTYFWRVRIKLEDNKYSPWSTNSFCYIKNSLEGWAQIDFNQLINSSFNGLYPDTIKENYFFYKVTAPGQFQVKNHGRDFPVFENYIFGKSNKYTDEKVIRNNFYTLIDPSNSANGMIAYVFEPYLNTNNGFNVWTKNFGVYQFNGEFRFNWMKTIDEINPVVLDSFISFLNQIPEGYHVILYSGYYHRIADMPERFYSAIESLGSSQIRKVNNNGVWLLVGTKGNKPGNFLDEQYTTKQDTLLQSGVSITVTNSIGSYQSQLIGPSKKWRHLKLVTKGINTSNALIVNSYNVLAIDKEGKKSVLVSNFKEEKLDLSFLDANKYPYIQLELQTQNKKNYTPAKPLRWIVNYDYLPEGLINSKLAYTFNSDTLAQGDLLDFEIGYQNVSKLALENIIVSFEIQNSNREVKYSAQDTIKPLAPGESTTIKKSINSNNLLNENKLIVRTNPGFKVPELYSFNNNFEKSFFVEGDFERPIMEVSFDGQRILDGDIISPKPTIVITGKDNNNFFLINDPSYFDIFLQKPDTVGLLKINELSSGFTFYSATSNTQTARIEYKPRRLMDGIYTLWVQLKDASGNSSGNVAYKVTFEVVGESSVTNFYAYPNPFSTEMKFVFTLTGEIIPDEIVIQLMTVSGKIVREVHKDELGALKIGNNISAFSWDGTDSYGNKLANGVYLYRVKTVINDTQINHRNTGTDGAFKENFGKIYILR